MSNLRPVSNALSMPARSVLSIAAAAFTFTYASGAIALPAFPGAEGFGTTTPGGRGGPVKVVTTLSGSGAGSFREAMLTSGPRIIVFRVSGVIDLRGENITLGGAHSNVTVLGQSSPGGITIIGGSITNYHSDFHDGVFRFLRLRRQDGGDTIAFNPVYNLVLDHLDMSGSGDEVMDLDSSHDVTVQWSTWTNSDSRGQNYGALIAYDPNTNLTFHHNLSAHHLRRCGAEFHWADSAYGRPTGNPPIDIRNNVFYNCGFDQIYRLELSDTFPNINLIGNYAKAGPNTPSGAAYINGGARLFNSDNTYVGRTTGSGSTVSAAHTTPPVATSSAAQAYRDVLDHVGSWPRDAMNLRTIAEVENGTGTLGKINDALDTDSPTPPTDTDLDGIPDSWEVAHGLNPNTRSDSATIHSSGYAYVEVYLSEVAEDLTGQEPPLAPAPPTNVTAN